MKPAFASRSLVFVVVALGAISACRSDPPALSADAPVEAVVPAEEDAWIAIGDTLVVTSRGRPELDLREDVGIDGRVFVPDLGPVEIAGLTKAEIETILIDMLSRFYDRLTIEVSIVPHSKRYFLFGEGADAQVFEAITRPEPK